MNFLVLFLTFLLSKTAVKHPYLRITASAFLGALVSAFMLIRLPYGAALLGVAFFVIPVMLWGSFGKETIKKAKLEELSADLLSSDFLKGAIDAGGKFIDVLDGIVKSGSAIPAVATAISAALSFKNVGRVKIVALM